MRCGVPAEVRPRRRGLPVTVVMAGGYNKEVGETVEVHLQTVGEACRHFDLWGRMGLEEAFRLFSRMGRSNGSNAGLESSAVV
jgi:hypothetical protein